jgi:hypothetical protein
MYGVPLSSGARRQLLWLAIGTILVVLLAIPFLLPLGATGLFLLSCIGLVGIIIIGERQEQLHRAQER